MPVLKTAIVRFELDPFAVSISREGTSFGMLVDRRIERAMENDETIREVTIQFEPEEWSDLCTQSLGLRSKAKKL